MSNFGCAFVIIPEVNAYTYSAYLMSTCKCVCVFKYLMVILLVLSCFVIPFAHYSAKNINFEVMFVVVFVC